VVQQVQVFAVLIERRLGDELMVGAVKLPREPYSEGKPQHKREGGKRGLDTVGHDNFDDVHSIGLYNPILLQVKLPVERVLKFANRWSLN
jgi:hypothetical protein